MGVYGIASLADVVSRADDPAPDACQPGDCSLREAIVAAQKANMPLVIAGIIQDKQYFEGAIAPHIDGEKVRFLGAVEREQKAAVLGGARALLHLISFDEPFGFSVVEAMACGTPVIATDRGSMRELIIEGTNGALIEAGKEIVVPRAQFDPHAVRATVEHRFARDRMVDDYLALYHRILASGAAARP